MSGIDDWNGRLADYVVGFTAVSVGLFVLWLLFVLFGNRIWKRCCSRTRRHVQLDLQETKYTGNELLEDSDDDLHDRVYDRRGSNRGSDATSTHTQPDSSPSPLGRSPQSLWSAFTYPLFPAEPEIGSPPHVYGASSSSNFCPPDIDVDSAPQTLGVGTDPTIPLASRKWSEMPEVRDELFDLAEGAYWTDFIEMYVGMLHERWSLTSEMLVDVGNSTAANLVENLPLTLGSNVVVVGEGIPVSLKDYFSRKTFSQSMLLTGPAGSGKSFQMQRLVLEMLQEIYHSPTVTATAPLPIYVDCGILALTSYHRDRHAGGDFQLIRDLVWLAATGYNDAKTALLKRKWDEFIDSALYSKRVLLIFDSLDYFEATHLHQIIQAISMFAPNCPFIVIGRNEDPIREALQENYSFAHANKKMLVSRTSLLSDELSKLFFENYWKVNRSLGQRHGLKSDRYFWPFSHIVSTMLLDQWESHLFKYPYHLLQLCHSLSRCKPDPNALIIDVETKIAERTVRHLDRAVDKYFPNTGNTKQIQNFLQRIVLALSHDPVTENAVNYNLSNMSFLINSPIAGYSSAQLKVFANMLYHLKVGSFEHGGRAFRLNPVYFDIYGRFAWLDLARSRPNEIEELHLKRLVNTGSSMIFINLLSMAVNSPAEAELGTLPSRIELAFSTTLTELTAHGFNNNCGKSCYPWLVALQAAVFRSKREVPNNIHPASSVLKTALQRRAGEFCLWALQLNVEDSSCRLKVNLETFQAVELIYSVCGCCDETSFELIMTEGLRFQCTKIRDLTLAQISMVDTMNDELQRKLQDFIFTNDWSRTESSQTRLYIEQVREPYRSQLRYTAQLAFLRNKVYYALWMSLLLFGVYNFARFHPWTTYDPLVNGTQHLHPLMGIPYVNDRFFEIPHSEVFPLYYKNIVAMLCASVCLVVSVSMGLNSVLPGLVGLARISAPKALSWKFWTATTIADLPAFSLFWVIPLLGGFTTLFSLLSTFYGSNCATAWVACSTAVQFCPVDTNVSTWYNPVTDSFQHNYLKVCNCNHTADLCCSLSMSYENGLWLPCGYEFLSVSFVTMFAPVTYASRRLGSWPQLALTILLSPVWSLLIIFLSAWYLLQYAGAIICITVAAAANIKCAQTSYQKFADMAATRNLKWSTTFTALWGSTVLALMLILVPVIASYTNGNGGQESFTVFLVFTVCCGTGLLVALVLAVFWTTFGFDEQTRRQLGKRRWFLLRIKFVVYKLSLFGLIGGGLLFSVGLLVQIGEWVNNNSSKDLVGRSAQLVWLTGIGCGALSTVILGLIRFADYRFINALSKRDSRDFDVFDFIIDVLWCMHASSKSECILAVAALQVVVKHDQSDEFNRWMKLLLLSFVVVHLCYLSELTFAISRLS